MNTSKALQLIKQKNLGELELAFPFLYKFGFDSEIAALYIRFVNNLRKRRVMHTITKSKSVYKLRTYNSKKELLHMVYVGYNLGTTTRSSIGRKLTAYLEKFED